MLRPVLNEDLLTALLAVKVELGAPLLGEVWFHFECFKRLTTFEGAGKLDFLTLLGNVSYVFGVGTDNLRRLFRAELAVEEL